MRIRQAEPFKYGYNSITEMNGKHSNMLMDFGILKMKKDDVQTSSENLERAYLLIHGEVTLEWEGNKVTAKREDCFSEDPYCLHVPSNVEVKITCLKDDTEIAVQKTDNEKAFPAKLYTPDECRSEQFGAGTLNETATRTVRTIFDHSNSPDANLVIGEVINHPGKYSSYPPHHHPQPEIYHYRFYPEQGYGLSVVGDDAYVVNNMDTVAIPGGLVHPQTAAPGYAMYYVWMIRHLDNNPFDERIFVDEHKWLLDKDAKIWPAK
ncbi:5-deoxy-glucuronate isomerase [Crassaminicella thermophila]|uniref:5-deoxy-glucuronate isomerase n=1 Tax=Crassaminicella thermophila TaxID=2599308 RepID=A0A5C0SAK3_CRATE|nr:5-deoxy-glucuronate isomerase [Crassaminicella thermophila]QEK11603.1 5-deoxy-glucuronate isomerase [Crassaminicella thermophila]